MPELEPTFRAAPAFPVAFDDAEAPVVVADVMVADVMVPVATLEFEETDAVTAPAPSSPPLATGTVVTVERVLEEMAELAMVEAMDED